MVVLRWVMRIVVLVVVLVVLVFVGARFHDGPLGPIPGGPLASGALVGASRSPTGRSRPASPRSSCSSPPQTKSRTTWIIVHDGKAYIPAATEFPPGKTWHRTALEDGRATLRIAGKRYPVTLAKVDDPAARSRAVRDVALGKYPARPGGEVWLFAVTSRARSRG